MSDEDIIEWKKRDDKRIKERLDHLVKEEKKKTPSDLPDKEIIEHKRKLFERYRMADVVLGPIRIKEGVVEPVRIRALLKFCGNRDDLEALGIHVRSVNHDCFTIDGTKEQIAILASQPATVRISLPKRGRPTLEEAIPAHEIDQIHPLGQGQGVIVGIIDSALDVRHHAFRIPTGTNDSRIL